ncbi:bifunctional glycosyltransferase family 2/GtrA family protein [Microbispora hainanensis]|uniref:bifunctional glycosyltransferase family 2/GtrA family protein n=1 Tax=Microbispora TaxID=2005 RepID=UPI001158ABB5|nr:MULTISPECIES: bifunctional glycosyltransferase family 2/GtrA family protein [Microbispora]NJP23201.1 bifunctional glycosyltransferase family 2/GtrA family protein [Microbispora sp. CL1-1]TQS16290.1 glycosyltransferase [Microbispora sp. SCL1-1]
MSTTTVSGPAAGASRRTRLVEVVVPVHNEERVLAASVERLHAYLSGDFPYGFRVTIADNASTDGTWTIARRLAHELPGVRAVHLDQKGRGRALRRVWESSEADVVGYMDVDLSTDLDAFLPLIAPLMTGHSDLAIGTRLSPWSNVVRGPKREIISRAYNLLLRSLMGARFSDAQCGFKAARTEIVQALLPTVQDEAWFFDTELLLLAEQHGLRIHEVPVDWVDDPDSRVDIVRTAVDDLKGMVRVARGSLAAPAAPPSRASARTQIPAFTVIGAISTVAYLALFWMLRSVLPPVAANAVALFVTAVANTAANRRFTFGVRGRAGALRHHLGGLVAFVAGLALTSAGLVTLPDGAPRAAELAAVVVANGLATLLRFLLLRTWVFAPRKDFR